MGWMFNQIKMKMELIDPQIQSSKIQSVMRYWIKQLSAVINRTASRSIIAGADNLVEKVNTTLPITLSSELCEGHLDANSEAANRFIEDMELEVINQDYVQTWLLIF